jgi:hypothetical protein
MPSLCTARLVSKGLCQAASERVAFLNVNASELRGPPFSFLNRFTGLKAIMKADQRRDMQ